MGSPWSKQLGSLRRDGKQFVDKRRRKKREKERKKRKQEERKKGEREEEAFFPPLFQIWVDQERILHTTRGEGSFLFGYFLVWGHENGIWLILLCDCLKE